MPVHLIRPDDTRPFADVVTEAITAIERRETITAVVERGGELLVITQKRPGRPAKETRGVAT